MKLMAMVSVSEISIKGKNKGFFLKIIRKAIETKILEAQIDFKIVEKDSLFVLYFNSEEDRYNASEILKKIIGISWIYWGYEVKTERESIQDALSRIIEFTRPTSYRFTAKVYKKRLWASTNDFIIEFAKYIRDNFHLTVSLEKYDLEIIAKVMNDSVTYIYQKYAKGLEGMPTSSSGRGLVFLSGGIDSPVASFLAQRRGIEVDFVTFLTPVTSTEETISKIKDLAKTLSKFNLNQSKLYIINLAKIQRRIKEHSFENYRIVLLRRAFFRIAERLKEQNKYDVFITGDAIGQVASQTIPAQTVISQVTDTLIVRPLITYTKEEIITIAKRIDTYEISIRPGDDTCSLFAPENPIINPKLDKVLMLESRIKDIKEAIDEIIEFDVEEFQL